MIQEKELEIEKLKNTVAHIVERWGFTHDSKSQKIIEVNNWLRNFDASEIPTVYHLLEHINLQRDIHVNTCLVRIVEEIKKDFGSDVNKIRIFAIGHNAASSGGQFLYQLRTHLKLNDSHFPVDPSRAIRGSCAYVFIDDFIGSGRQATEYYRSKLNKLSIKCYYYSLYGYQKGKNHIEKNGGFRKVFVSELLNIGNKIFSEESTLSNKIQCEEIARKWGERLYPEHPFGYEDSQSMICFLENCPNNTLPIIWAGPKSESSGDISWSPLFERKKSLPSAESKALLKMQNNSKNLIEFFYSVIEEKKFDAAFECLSSRLKDEKYKKDDAKYFASGYHNTISIFGLTIVKILSQKHSNRYLVHYNEKVRIFKFGKLSELRGMQLSNVEQAFEQINLFREKLVDDLGVESAKVEKIPLSYFLSINVVEECCWFCQIPFEEIESNFESTEITMSRAKYLDCKFVDGRWYIDKFNSILHTAEPL